MQQSVTAHTLFAESYPSVPELAEPILEGDDSLPPAVLPAILLTTAFAMVLMFCAFAVSYFVLSGTLLASAVVTLFAFVLFLGPLGIISAWLTGTPVLLSNLLWSIALIMGVGAVFGVCSVMGAVAALFVQALGLGV